MSPIRRQGTDKSWEDGDKYSLMSTVYSDGTQHIYNMNKYCILAQNRNTLCNDMSPHSHPILVASIGWEILYKMPILYKTEK